MFFMEG